MFFKLPVIKFYDDDGGAGGGDGGGGDKGGDGGDKDGDGAPKGVYDQGGKGGAGGDDLFKGMLPDDLKDHASLKDIKDVASLAKSYVNAQSMIGLDKIALPNDKSTPEVISDFHKRLGRPDAPEKYGFDLKAIPEGLAGREEIHKWAEKAFFDGGLSAKQGKALYDGYAQILTQQLEAVTAKRAEDVQTTLAELKTVWGAAFNQNLALSKSGMLHVGGEELKEYMDSSGLGNHPAIVKAFAKVGQMLANDGLIDGKIDGGFQSTPDQAKQKIKELESDVEFLKRFHNPDTKIRKIAIEEKDNLYKIAFPESSVVA